MRFRYGNRYQLLKKFKKSKKSGNDNKHKWTAYFEPVDARIKMDKLIDQVEFHLDPDFKNPRKIKSELPFQHTAIGWGTFDLDVLVVWKEWTGMEPSKMTFEIVFAQEGVALNFTVKMDKDLYKKYMK